MYVPTVISGCSWFCEIASGIDSKGLNAASKFTVRIPADADFSGKVYTDPEAYADSDPENTFTLRTGDILVHGSANIKGATPADLQKLYGYKTVTILGVTDNCRAPNGRHWKVVGK